MNYSFCPFKSNDYEVPHHTYESYMIVQFGIASENIKIQRLILMYDTELYLYLIDSTLTLFYVTNNTTF